MSATGHQQQQERSNRRLLSRLVVVVVAMFGFGFLLVPFYEKICEVTGLRNIAQADEVHALHYAPVGHVEAGDHPGSPHALDATGGCRPGPPGPRPP